MAIVQFQRFNSRGALVEYFSRDVRDNHHYLTIIEPLDALARHENGSTRTVAEGSPLYIGGIPDASEQDRGFDRVYRHRWQFVVQS